MLPIHPISGSCIILIVTICTINRFSPSAYHLLWHHLTPSPNLFRPCFQHVSRFSQGKTLIFCSTTSWSTTSVLRLPFGLWLGLQPYPPNRLIKFLFVGSRTLLHHFLHPYHYWYRLSLHLAVNTRGWTFTSNTSAILGTQTRTARLYRHTAPFVCLV